MTKKNLSEALLLTVMVTSVPALANEANVNYAEFDDRFLNHQQMQSYIDLDNYRYGNPIYPREYLADIYLNDRLIGREMIEFRRPEQADGQVYLCMNSTLVKRLGLNYKTLSKSDELQALTKESCAEYQALFPEGSRFNFDLATQQLKVTIPQRYLNNLPRDYIDPEFWDEGVNSAFLNYNFNYYHNEIAAHRYNNAYLRLNSGINLGSWHFRHSGSVHHDTDGNNRYQYYQTYLQHDIPAWRSQLSIGDNYTQSNLFNGSMIRGVQLSTDTRMLPASMRGYAPQITGQANSNAMVQVFQSGQEIYNITVPPGPFVISDLYSIGQYGELLVRITEADGSVREFTVPYSSAARLLRPGLTNYEIDLGELVSNNHSLNEKGVQLTWEHGFSNSFTANAGLIIGQHYRAALLGSVWSTPIGTVGMDLTAARAKINALDDASTGARYHVNYNYRIPYSRTNLMADASFYSKESFYSWYDVAQINDEADQSTVNNVTQSIRSEYQIALSQPIDKDWGNLTFSLNYKDYWDQSFNQNSWAVAYSNYWGIVQYNVSLNRYYYRHSDRSESEVGLNITIPFSSSFFVSAYAQRNENTTTVNTNLSGVLGEDNQYNYGLNYNVNSHSDNSWYINAGARTHSAKLLASYGKQNRDSSQFSLGAEGAVVVHSGGILTSSYLGDTFAIVHAKDAKGARITRGQNIYLNKHGYAILPYLVPYTKNIIDIDPSGLPMEVTLVQTQQSVAPRANSSVLIDIPTSSGKTALLQLTLPNGKFVPVGASLFDKHGEHQGVVSSAGRVLVQPNDEAGYFEVRWGKNSCRVEYDLEEATQELQGGIALLKRTCIVQ